MGTQGLLELGEAGRVAEEAADGSPLWWKIQALVNDSDQLLVKKLSRNDTSWADDPRKHQAGFYIPSSVRDSDFFPRLEIANPEKPHIFFAEVDVLWPQTGETTRSTMRHYSNKGPETHFTRLPKDLFQALTPASLLLIGRLLQPIAGARWWVVVLDSSGEEAELLETMLDLPVDFHHALLPAALFRNQQQEPNELDELIARFRNALRTGTLGELAADFATLPDPAMIAKEARDQWLHEHGLTSFDPWVIPRPGDAIMEISRDIEYRIYRQHELRRRSAELLAILSGEDDLAATVIRRYPDIDAVLLSASQQRKSRAGRSFEWHIACALRAADVQFQEQAVTGGRRPDFVLPDVQTLRLSGRAKHEALVLSAKTTLRERWKQVSSERLNCDVFLATVDDRVAPASIREMEKSGIRLVVPESLKTSKEAWYHDQSNVLSFREFFDNPIRAARPFLIQRAC